MSHAIVYLRYGLYLDVPSNFHAVIAGALSEVVEYRVFDAGIKGILLLNQYTNWFGTF